MSAPKTEALLVRTADGWTLRGELLSPSAEPAVVTVLGHAMMVSRRTLDSPRGAGLASTLAACGLAVMTFDLRGHGESGPSAREGASFDFDDIVKHDVPSLVRAARARFPAAHVVLIGHSLTAHAALVAAGLDATGAPDAIVALAANLWMPKHEPRIALRGVKGALLRTWRAATLSRGYFDARRWRVGTDAEPWAYVRQLCGFWARDRLTSSDGALDYEQALGEVRLRVLSVSSEGDRLARPRCVRAFVGLMPRARVVHRVVTSIDVGRPPGHMGLVLDAAMRPVWREIAGWIRTSRTDGPR